MQGISSTRRWPCAAESSRNPWTEEGDEMAKTTRNKARAKAAPSKERVPAAAKKKAASTVKVEIKEAEPKRRPVEPIDDEQRRRMIAEAAYYRAERRGFVGGSSVDDWIAAEIEVDARLARG